MGFDLLGSGYCYGHIFGFGSVLGKVLIMFRVLSRYQADGLGFEIPGSVYGYESGLGLVPFVLIRFRADVLGFGIPGSGYGYKSVLVVVPYQARFLDFKLGLRWQCWVLIRFWADGFCFAYGYN